MHTFSTANSLFFYLRTKYWYRLKWPFLFWRVLDSTISRCHWEMDRDRSQLLVLVHCPALLKARAKLQFPTNLSGDALPLGRHGDTGEPPWAEGIRKYLFLPGATCSLSVQPKQSSATKPEQVLAEQGVRFCLIITDAVFQIKNLKNAA